MSTSTKTKVALFKDGLLGEYDGIMLLALLKKTNELGDLEEDFRHLVDGGYLSENGNVLKLPED